MTQNDNSKTRRLVIMIGILGVLIGANVIVHSRRPSSPAPASTPAPSPAVAPVQTGQQNANVQVAAEPKTVAKPVSYTATPTTTFPVAASASGSSDWSQALAKVDDLEQRLAALPNLFPAPSQTAAFSPPPRDPFRWKSPAAPALVVAPASVPVVIQPIEPVVSSPPVLLGIIHARGKNQVLIRDGAGIYTLTEGVTDPQLPFRLVSLHDGVKLQDAKGRDVEVIDPQQEDRQRVAQVRQILEGRGGTTIYRVLSSPAPAAPAQPPLQSPPSAAPGPANP